MEMTNKKNAWKIIKGECTLPEAMKYFGKSQKYIDETMEVIKKRTFTILCFILQQGKHSNDYLMNI